MPFFYGYRLRKQAKDIAKRRKRDSGGSKVTVGTSGARVAVFLWLSSAKAGERHSEASRKAALKIFTKTSQKMQRFCIFFL